MEDLNIGVRYERLTIQKFVKKERGHRYYSCSCVCGNIKVVRLSSLKTGNTVSCGCYSKERTSKRSKEVHTKHGLRRHPLYSVWANMKDRCENSNCNGYVNYGGRGISVCPEWSADFTKFYEWATTVGGYKRGLTIERVDVNKGYYPENCIFANVPVQSRNRRNSRLITIDGVTKNWIDWCRYYGMPESTVRNRMNKGMDIKAALTEPVRGKGGSL